MPDSIELRIGIALVIGLVIGAEREQRMSEGAHRAAGIRTFAITALLGAIAHALEQPVVLGVLGAAVGTAAVVSYWLGDRTDPGLTSEIALVLTFALGALAIDRPTTALAVGITTALLLAYRARIHEAVREVLTPAELRDALIVAAAALVVLPLLPAHPVDPWGVLVPFTLWRLVVLILAIHLAAHVAQRMLGPRWGLPIAGLAGGFVSSSATIASMGGKAKDDPPHTSGAIAAAAASTVATFVQMALLVGAASPRLLEQGLWIPLAAGGSAALLYAGLFTLRSARGEHGGPPPGRAVDLRGALIFALLVTGVSVGATLVGRQVGALGVVIASTVAAFADAHAAGASVASVHAADQLETTSAIVAVLACLSTNSVTKSVLAYSSGPRGYALPVVLGVAIVLAATWGAYGLYVVGAS
ncbi:MgtC/SapB family protein [Sandaracinus amylolyticus]|uniref:MgtC/SapB family protein n=1 Tax=Sandaracinus amylolyticus TaxID=927083 RepID=UPI001F3F0ECB|nr:DUF4010 domain-containing protein [Sandaracinus amylolyticus]UJR85194.1 Hypothetical protein I5071_72740 [Sandaracinus amylolyticus]